MINGWKLSCPEQNCGKVRKQNQNGGKVRKQEDFDGTNREYFKIKAGIAKIDKNAFFVVTDAYEVSGGRWFYGFNKNERCK